MKMSIAEDKIERAQSGRMSRSLTTVRSLSWQSQLKEGVKVDALRCATSLHRFKKKN